MNPMQSAVKAWHEKLGVNVGDTPAIRRPELRVSLIEEEARETCEAIKRGDLVEAIDGMCDLLYVTFGTAVEFGVDLAPFFDEVHRANMLKVGGATRADGKILKPEGWQPPRIAEMLREHAAQSACALFTDIPGAGPCVCDLPRCPVCGYTKHDAAAELDHNLCPGMIPEVA